MRALRYHGRGDLRVDDVDAGALLPGMVQVDVEWCGICGSDLHEYESGPLSVPANAPHPLTGDMTPVVMGHEFAGTVSAVGEGAGDIAVGDRVAVEPLLYCRDCDYCRAGDYHMCAMFGVLGVHGIAGGFSQTAVVPAYTLHALPDSVSSEVGALVEPLAVGWHAMRKAGLREGQTALVIGAGPIGLASLLCAQAGGAALAIVSVRREGARAETARLLNADAVIDASTADVVAEVMRLTDGRGVDVVFETSGAQDAMDVAMKAVANLGTIVSLAVWPQQGQIDYMTLLLKEAVLVGSKAYNEGDFPEVIAALADGRIRGAEQIITKRVALDEVVEGGFEVLIHDKGQHVKVLVTP